MGLGASSFVVASFFSICDPSLCMDVSFHGIIASQHTSQTIHSACKDISKQTMTMGLTKNRQRTSVAVLSGGPTQHHQGGGGGGLGDDNHDPATVQAAALRALPDNKYNKKRRGRRKGGSNAQQQQQQAQLVGLAVCCITLFLLARFLTMQHQEKGLHYHRVRLSNAFLWRQ